MSQKCYSLPCCPGCLKVVIIMRKNTYFPTEMFHTNLTHNHKNTTIKTWTSILINICIYTAKTKLYQVFLFSFWSSINRVYFCNTFHEHGSSKCIKKSTKNKHKCIMWSTVVKTTGIKFSQMLSLKSSIHIIYVGRCSIY